MGFDPEVVDGKGGGCQNQNGADDAADCADDAGTAALLQQ